MYWRFSQVWSKFGHTILCRGFCRVLRLYANRTHPTIFSPLRACYSLFVILPCFIAPYMYVCCHGNLVFSSQALYIFRKFNIQTYMYMPVCLYTCTPLFFSSTPHYRKFNVQTYMPVCLYTSTPLPLYPCTPVRLYTSTSLRLYVSTPLHLNASTSLHLYSIPLHLYASNSLHLYSTPLHLYASTPLCVYASTPLRRLYTSIPQSLYLSTPLHLYTSTPLLYTSTPLCLYASTSLHLYTEHIHCDIKPKA